MELLVFFGIFLGSSVVGMMLFRAFSRDIAGHTMSWSRAWLIILIFQIMAIGAMFFSTWLASGGWMDSLAALAVALGALGVAMLLLVRFNVPTSWTGAAGVTAATVVIHGVVMFGIPLVLFAASEMLSGSESTP